MLYLLGQLVVCTICRNDDSYVIHFKFIDQLQGTSTERSILLKFPPATNSLTHQALSDIVSSSVFRRQETLTFGIRCAPSCCHSLNQ